MGILVSILALAVIIGIIYAVKYLPLKIQIALLILFSVGLAWLHWSIANTQLATTGFAARNRDPNYIAQWIGYALTLLALVNVPLALRTKKYAAIVLAILFCLVPIMFFISW